MTLNRRDFRHYLHTSWPMNALLGSGYFASVEDGSLGSLDVSTISAPSRSPSEMTDMRVVRSSHTMLRLWSIKPEVSNSFEAVSSQLFLIKSTHACCVVTEHPMGTYREKVLTRGPDFAFGEVSEILL